MIKLAEYLIAHNYSQYIRRNGANDLDRIKNLSLNSITSLIILGALIPLILYLHCLYSYLGLLPLIYSDFVGMFWLGLVLLCFYFVIRVYLQRNINWNRIEKKLETKLNMRYYVAFVIVCVVSFIGSLVLAICFLRSNQGF